MTRVTLKDVPAKWRAREEFNCNGTLTGHIVSEGMSPSVGRLNDDEINRLITDLPNLAYVVMSYRTPIAWVLRDGTEYRVVQRFSVTTSKHQGRLY